MRKRLNVISLLTGILLVCATGVDAQVRGIAPTAGEKSAVKSAAIDAGDYIYISAQGPKGADGSVPGDFEAQAAQSLENIKYLLVSDGLTLEHVVYVQVYLENISDYERLNAVFKKYFPKTPPARAVL